MKELELIEVPEKALVLFEITPQAIAERLKEYDGLKVVEADTKSYKEVRAALTNIVHTRVEVDKRRKALGEAARKTVSSINGAAKMLLEPMAPYEERFKTELKAEDDRKQAIKDEAERKESERIAGIQAKIAAFLPPLRHDMTSQEISEIEKKIVDFTVTKEEFQEFSEEAEKSLDAAYDVVKSALAARIQFEKEEAERKAEAERLAKIKAEQEAEAARLKAEQDKIDEEKRKIQREKDRIEAEKKAEADRVQREKREAEIREEAKAQAEREAREAAEQAERDRIDREKAEEAERKRQEALRPDKEKLWNLSDKIGTIDMPAVKSKDAKEILNWIIEELDDLSKLLRQKAEEL